MKNRWSYLDKMDFNLLYQYADVLSGKRKQIHMDSHAEREESGRETYLRAEKRRDNAYYLIWFTYRYLLECKTYEDTIPYQTEEVLSRYRLIPYVRAGYIFIDFDGDVFFRKPDDISMILQILYGRYDYFAQMKCFIQNTKKYRSNRALRVLEENKERLRKLKLYPEEEDES